MRIVFWNTNKNENINEYISDIIVEQEIDILVLAEYESDIEELKKMLALYNIVIEQAITIGCDRITILKRKENIQPAFQNKYCSMQIIDDMYLLVCLHLPSKLYADVLKRGIAIARIIVISSFTVFQKPICTSRFFKSSVIVYAESKAFDSISLFIFRDCIHCSRCSGHRHPLTYCSHKIRSANRLH